MRTIQPAQYATLKKGQRLFFNSIGSSEPEPGTLLYAYSRIVEQRDESGRILDTHTVADRVGYVPESRPGVLETHVCRGEFRIFQP